MTEGTDVPLDTSDPDIMDKSGQLPMKQSENK